MLWGNRSGRCVAVALVATLLLRASIPDGYMPAPAGSGLLYQLCPIGLPADFMHALAGSESHHHHDTADAGHYDASQCPIGHLLASAAAVDSQYLEPEPPATAEAPVSTRKALHSTRRLTIRLRGPPA